MGSVFQELPHLVRELDTNRYNRGVRNAKTSPARAQVRWTLPMAGREGRVGFLEEAVPR